MIEEEVGELEPIYSISFINQPIHQSQKQAKGLTCGYRSDDDENNENNEVVLGDCLGGSELIRRARQENL